MNNYFRAFLVTLTILLGANNPITAQVNDAGLWASVNLEKKFSKKVSIHFSEELRFNENISELGMFFSELTGEYQFSKMFSLSGGYRFIQKRRLDDSYSIRHRYLVNLNVKYKFGQLGTNFRLRYQSQYADVESSSDGKVPENYLRPKLTLKYDLNKKYTPYISGEMFIHLNRPEGTLFDTYRVEAGIDYEISKRSSVDLGYLINKEVQVVNPLTNYVIVIGWNYIFK